VTGDQEIYISRHDSENPYDGPLDVLLSMIRRAKYPIDALPVGEITGQFREYIRTNASSMVEDLAHQFVETASWLVLLKSRSLLPRDEADAPTGQDELRQTLMDHAALSSAVTFLSERVQYGISSVSPQEVGQDDPWGEFAANLKLQDVVESARLALESLRAAASISIEDPVTVEEKANWIQMQLAEVHPGMPINTADWFITQSSRQGTAALFLALLEEARRGALKLYQPRALGDLFVKSISPTSTTLPQRDRSSAGPHTPA
jgi:segregation and condensation protein A